MLYNQIMELTDSIAKIKGVGSKYEKLLHKIGLKTVGDLLHYPPVFYRDLSALSALSEVKEGDKALLKGEVTVSPRWIRRTVKTSLFKFEVSDKTGVLDVHIYNMPYAYNHYAPGSKFFFFGRLKQYRNRFFMENPEILPVGEGTGVLAYYPLTKGLTQKRLRGYVKTALEEVRFEEGYSRACGEKYGFNEDKADFCRLHRPSLEGEYEAARKSLAFKELLVFHRKLELLAKPAKKVPPFPVPEDAVERFLAKLPFTCTKAQLRTIQEIYRDVAVEGRLSNRLIQGDVGAGKTVIAMFAAYLAHLSGKQALIMAPTELLAEQHFQFAREIFGGQAVAIYRGATGKAERKDIGQKLEKGEVSLLITTHAILYGDLAFKNLGAAVIDEQHRFGVAQRAYVSRISEDTHMFIMSATPIPRTLALALYGVTQISVLDELPPGRKPVATHIVSYAKRQGLYEWVKAETEKGEKAYVVCPLLEESEILNVKSVLEVQEELKGLFKPEQIGILYGALSSSEKKEVMDRFRSGEISLVISTTVVEVGIDVSDAGIIVIENADRFGLAQLHQLRGRVGRGGQKAFCYLLSDGSALERLRLLKSTNNGFEVARLDLEHRGMGQFFGEMQHGKSAFQIADPYRDMDILIEAKKALGIIKSEFPEDYRLLHEKARNEIKRDEDFAS